MTRPPAATRAVVFDMDGVLIDSGAHHRAAWSAMLDEVGVAPPPEFWRLTIGRPSEDDVWKIHREKIAERVIEGRGEFIAKA